MAAQTVTKVQYENNVTVIGAENLNAMQDAVNNHASLIDGLDSDKVDKVTGKGLSTNDFNNEAQQKLNNLPTGEQLDTSLGQKVSKRTSGTEVYTHNGSTQGGATLTETPTAGAVPMYGTGGVLKAAAPVADNDVVRKAELDDVKDNLDAAFVTNTASGAIASFPDGADNVPVKSLVVNIEPVQEGAGDPSPENVRPISGWTGMTGKRTGKNLIDTSGFIDGTAGGITYTRNADGSINASGTSTGSNGYRSIYSASDRFCLPVGTYIASGGTANTAVQINTYDKDGNLIARATAYNNPVTVIVTEETDYILVVVGYITTDRTVNETVYPQLELGSTATDYEPYVGTDITADWSSVVPGGTVYGGSLNLTTGVLTVDRLAADLGATTWSIYSGGTYFVSSAINYLIDPDIIVKPPATVALPDVLCSFYKPSIASHIINATYDNIIGISPSNGRFLIRDSSVDTVEALTAKVTGQKVVARIEPQTYQLTKSQITGILTTLHGNNNIWADCGNTEVTYCADTKLYIEHLTQPTEDDMTADHAISAGTFFMISNNLYLATSQIAAGATITPGTNATQLSLADALNQLNA